LIEYFQAGYDLWLHFHDVETGTWKGSGVVFPPMPPAPVPTPKSQARCVLTTKDLIMAVKDCDKRMNETSCLIDICSNRLRMSESSSSYEGIDVSNKNIYLSCEQECAPKRCIVDGLGITRLFYGSNTNVTFLNFIFANGFHPHNGGGIKLENNSIATIINCSFVNNSAPSGSAVQVNNSQLIVSGIKTSVVNNNGIGPPLELVSSHMNITQAIFAGNQVSEYLADILLFDSIINIYDVHFLTSSTVPFKECHVHIAMLADDYNNKSSCMNVDPSNKSFPLIDLSESCLSATSSTTLSPIPAPIPRAVLCFSGQNFVEIQHVGNVPISQLRIGDYVMSSDSKFTQVYGFGHFNHNRDGTFLQIMFHDNENRETISFYRKHEPSSLSFIEISVRHLLMIERNHKQYRVASGDVRVDDIVSGKRVKSIQVVIRRGVYAPLTQSGDILVNGILASNYVDLLELPSMILLPDQHTLAHIFFYPQRMFCHSFFEICKKEIYIHGYGPLSYLLVGGSFLFNCMMSNTIDPTSIVPFLFLLLLCMLMVVLVIRRS
jgi:Hint module